MREGDFYMLPLVSEFNYEIVSACTTSTLCVVVSRWGTLIGSHEKDVTRTVALGQSLWREVEDWCGHRVLKTTDSRSLVSRTQTAKQWDAAYVLLEGDSTHPMFCSKLSNTLLAGTVRPSLTHASTEASPTPLFSLSSNTPSLLRWCLSFVLSPGVTASA